jgi:hypothetical protein
MQKLTLFAAATGSRVDREYGILRGVSVITEGEAKGHGMIVDGVTIEQVKACAETYVDGLRVKMDHATGIDAMVGVLRDFQIDGIQLRADLHLIKSHEDFEKILEMAENMPGSFGLSISFSGESEDVEVPYDDTEKVEPNSGELPPSVGGSVEIVRAARCMEIYSADLVDQPAANPSGLFQAMSEPTAPEEVPAEVEETKVEEVTESQPEEEKADEAVVELQVDGPKGTQHDPEGPKEVKGPEGTQNLPEGVVEIPASDLPVETIQEIAEQVGVDPSEIESVGVSTEAEELPEEKLSSKLSAVVLNFENTKAEVINLRADLETAHRNLSALKAEVEKRDLAIAKLEDLKRIALRAAGLLPSDVEIEIEAQAAPFNPAEAYAAAVEAGDKKLAAELFKQHKAAIFAARRN